MISLAGSNLFGTRVILKYIVPFLIGKWIPLVGALSFLSVGLFVAIYFHNKEVSRQEQEWGM